MRDKIRNPLKNKYGTSLVEAMVTMLIFSLIAAGLYSVSVASENSWQDNKTLVELHQELRKALEWIRYDLYDSKVYGPAGSTWSDTLEFYKPEGISGWSIDWDDDDTIYIECPGCSTDTPGQLTRTIEDEYGVKTTDRIIAQDISSIQARRAYNMVEVSISAQKDTVKKRKITSSVDFKIMLRN